jgi:hypothetical protein
MFLYNLGGGAGLEYEVVIFFSLKECIEINVEDIFLIYLAVTIVANTF